MTSQDKKSILRIALYAGEILLKNGSETYRTEDTIEKICNSRNLKHVSSFVTPTGIFISENRFDGICFIKRIKERTINLEKISEVNSFARDFVDSDMSSEDAIKNLKRIDKANKYGGKTRVVFTGLASGFFALLFGASVSDFFLAFIIAMITIIVTDKINILSKTAFLGNAVGGALITLLALVSRKFGLGNSTDMIIVGAIMPLVPGVALTNGLRDFISGDLVSGVSRVAEAILIAVAIAAGAGTVLKLWINIFGGAY